MEMEVRGKWTRFKTHENCNINKDVFCLLFNTAVLVDIGGYVTLSL